MTVDPASVFDADPAPSTFHPAPMRGRHVQLRPVAPEDYRLLQRLDVGELSLRWRTRGATPSPEQWAQLLWNSVLAQFMVVRVSDRRPVGLVIAYRPSFQDGYAHLGAVAIERSRSPLMMFGCALFLDYVFTCWNLHKLYFELPEWNLKQFESALRKYCKLEGRLREHLYYDGRHWDELVLAIYRQDWSEQRERVMRVQTTKPKPVTAQPPRITRVVSRASNREWR